VRQLAREIRAEVDPSDLPDESTDLLFDLYAVLALAIGTAVSSEDVHNAWVAWMMRSDPHHPSLVAFEELDAETATSDMPFVEAIRSVADRRGLSARRSGA
jgi:hypothetical protein